MGLTVTSGGRRWDAQAVGRAGMEERTEEIEGRALEILIVMEESSTWMEEATPEEMGDGNTEGEGGEGRGSMDPLV